jgi:hypothetical protein
MRRFTGSIWLNVASPRFQRTWPTSHHLPGVAERTDKFNHMRQTIRASEAGKADVSRRVLAESTLEIARVE